MFRTVLLWLAGNAWLRRVAPRLWFTRRAVRRFMPGEDAAAALLAAEGFARHGIATIFTRLGEDVGHAADADAIADHYLGLIDDIQRRNLNGEVSVKLSQLGLDIDPARASSHLARLATAAALADRTVWIDMESSRLTDVTLDVYERIKKSHPNVGVCLQAYLRRTPSDLQRLLKLDPAIRLVKGAYAEAAGFAYQDGREVDANYVALSVSALEAMKRGTNLRLGLGTHDLALIALVAEHARALGLGKTSFEVQMLYGIREDDQRRLAADGFVVRDLIAYGEGWYPWYLRRLAERPANVLFVLRQLVPW